MPKSALQRLLRIGQEGVAGMALGHDEVDGQRGLRGADRPDVKVMDPRDARHSSRAVLTAGMAMALGNALQRERQRLAQQIPGRPDDHAGDDAG